MSKKSFRSKAIFITAITLMSAQSQVAGAKVEVPLLQEDIEAILEKSGVTEVSSSTLPEELRRGTGAGAATTTEAGIAAAEEVERSLREAAQKAVEGVRNDWRARLYQARDVWLNERLSKINGELDGILASAGGTPGELGGWFREQASAEYDQAVLVMKGLEELRSQNKILAFLIGPDSQTVSKTREALEKANGKLTAIEERKKDLTAPLDQAQLEGQANKIRAELENATAELNRLTSKFSLWGWLKNLFVTKPLKGVTS